MHEIIRISEKNYKIKQKQKIVKYDKKDTGGLM